MTDSTNLIGLYVAVPLYFCFLCGAAAWAYFRMKKHKQQAEAAGRDDDALLAHYLGSRTFGPILTAGTMFASLFSGYTVVGVPNEAFRTGWSALRWILGTSTVVIGYAGTGPRLRKAAMIRDHQSPTDFVTDRFRSQFLRYIAVLLQVFPAIVYLAAQCTALRTTFNSIFGIDPNSAISVVVIGALILLFECMGGLSSVALTDAVQGTIMCVCFIVIPIIISNYYGGWTELDWMTYPKPEFYQTPSPDTQWMFWNFAASNLGFFSLPHLVQRTYAAKDIKSLKMGYKVLAVGPWLTMIPGVFMGTVGVQMLAEKEKVGNAFAAILQTLMDLGGFPYVIAVIAFTASLAAIMSTADSLIIAISQVVTSECVRPSKPDASPQTITMIGRVVSLIAMVVAILISLFAGAGFGDLASIQFGLSMQIIPTFFVGLFGTRRTDCHPWSLAIGALSGFLSVFLIHYNYVKGFQRDVDGIPLNPGVTGCALNAVISFCCEVVHRLLKRGRTSNSNSADGDQQCEHHMGQPTWEIPNISRFGKEALTSDMLWGSMKGVSEPFCEPWFLVLIFVLTLTITPLSAGNTPPLNEDGSLSYAPGILGGIPTWAMSTILFSLMLTFVLLLAISRIPDKFPEDGNTGPNSKDLEESLDEKASSGSSGTGALAHNSTKSMGSGNNDSQEKFASEEEA